MQFAKATARYEEWLSARLRIVADDLEYKHEQMRSGLFPFLRATYYRWAQIWSEICGESAEAPQALGVGDLHVENFGTWRDAEGRLIWGVNDFDEAWRLPYTNDLIRLATSAITADLVCAPKDASAAILDGYVASLAVGGRPFALAEHHPVLRTMATARLHDPERFWEKMRANPPAMDVSPGARRALERNLPASVLEVNVVSRRAGLGSLGRERYVAIGAWCGGSVAREAKATAPSACAWAEGRETSAHVLYEEAVEHAVRCRDPFLRVQKRWLVRRLAPDCSRIELSSLPKERDELHLLHAMGWETANIHLGTIRARTLQQDLGKRPRGWLYEAARKMQKAVAQDFASQ
jgi:uncharacterized protein (DUF2252 family)